MVVVKCLLDFDVSSAVFAVLPIFVHATNDILPSLQNLTTVLVYFRFARTKNMLTIL